MELLELHHDATNPSAGGCTIANPDQGSFV